MPPSTILPPPPPPPPPHSGPPQGVPPPPPWPPGTPTPVDPTSRGQRTAATVALVVAFTGLVVPFVGPVLGTVVALTVLWDLRDQTPNSASRTAVWATIVGTALVGIPALVLALVKADDWTALPVLTITICIAVVIAGAMHLAGWGSRAAAGGVVAALAGMGIAGALAVLAALAITWLFVLLVSEIFEAIVDAFTESF